MFGFVGSFAQNKVRAIFHAFTFGFFACGYTTSKFNSYYKKITRLSSALALVSDASIVFIGGELKRKERISARLGDAMSYLYMACATLKYFKDNNERSSDEIFVKWAVEHCLYNAQDAIFEVTRNFGISGIGSFLRVILFPYGKPYVKPSDKLEHQIAQALLNDCETRQVFKSMCHVPDRYNDPAGRVEIAYQQVLLTHPIKAKISKAIKAKQLTKGGNLMKVANSAKDIGIISEDELVILTNTAKLVNEVIQVDEFGPYDLGPKNAHVDWNKSA